MGNWFKSVISLLFFLLIESLLVGSIIFILIHTMNIFSFNVLTYLQVISLVFSVKLMLNNIFATATYMTDSNDVESTEMENNNEDNKLA